MRGRKIWPIRRFRYFWVYEHENCEIVKFPAIPQLSLYSNMCVLLIARRGRVRTIARPVSIRLLGVERSLSLRSTPARFSKSGGLDSKIQHDPPAYSARFQAAMRVSSLRGRYNVCDTQGQHPLFNLLHIFSLLRYLTSSRSRASTQSAISVKLAPTV